MRMKKKEAWYIETFALQIMSVCITLTKTVDFTTSLCKKTILIAKFYTYSTSDMCSYTQRMNFYYVPKYEEL